ncbi:MAG: hypothetical protein HFG70_11955 [Hungatella sp.]|nr:hypothetical protein [Hungatella sp.]
MKLGRLGAKVLYILFQCTWGSIQTLAGGILFLRFRRCPHEMYHGAVYTRWTLEGGISLGLFIFTPDSREDWCRQMAVHEYGHTWQSLLLGPLYLAAVGLPSILWARLPGCIRMRKERGLSYSAFYTERWADYLGEKMAPAPGKSRGEA